MDKNIVNRCNITIYCTINHAVKKGDIARQLFPFYPRSTYQALKPIKGIKLLNKCI